MCVCFILVSQGYHKWRNLASFFSYLQKVNSGVRPCFPFPMSHSKFGRLVNIPMHEESPGVIINPSGCNDSAFLYLLHLWPNTSKSLPNSSLIKDKRVHLQYVLAAITLIPSPLCPFPLSGSSFLIVFPSVIPTLWQGPLQQIIGLQVRFGTGLMPDLIPSWLNPPILPRLGTRTEYNFKWLGFLARKSNTVRGSESGGSLDAEPPENT